MRVIVCGSRGWRDRDAVTNRLADLPGESTVVHGNAGGADRIAHQEAQKLGLLVESHPAAEYGHPLARNRAMAALGAELCIAFWDGRSTGTAHMMTQAREHGIPVEVVT
jgi:hypothetical protein